MLFWVVCTDCFNRRKPQNIKDMDENNKLINISTYLVDKGWGDCRIEDLALILNGVIYKYQHIIDENRYTKDICKIQPREDHPFCFKVMNNFQVIELSAKNRNYCQYVYQFAHEYCHFLINRDNKGERTGAYWFEETICELASIYMLRMMEQQWKINPPYPNWQSYHLSYKEYVDEIINRPSNKIDKTLKEWISERSDLLHTPEYQREMYTTIAVNIMDVFFDNPNLWNIITYIKEIHRLEYTTFENFINSLYSVLPDDLKKPFSILMDRLI